LEYATGIFDFIVCFVHHGKAVRRFAQAVGFRRFRGWENVFVVQVHG
jgi:hypothetical protein